MKINKIISGMACLAVIASSCTVNELTNQTELPEGTSVRLNFSSDPSAPPQGESTRASWEDSKGSGNLTFRWEKVDIDSEESDEQVLIVTDGEKPVSVIVSSKEEPVSYSGLSVTPREGDAHYASFQTVGYYSTDDLKTAKYCFAATGAPVITEDTGNGRQICELPEKPSTFVQPTSQDPSFLRDYMYMYSTAAYSGNGNTLSFKHIPATFRFIISNATDEPVQVDEIHIKTASGSPIASKSSDIIFDWSDGAASLSFGEDAYDMVSVSPDAGAAVAAGERYTAYAMVLPLADNDAFKGKTVNFTIKNNGTEQLAFQLSGEKLAAINGTDIYNWIGGKSYTLRINIGADEKVTGYIIEDKTIEVSSDIYETYTLKYEDANGAPLGEYADICTLAVDEVAYYRDFINVNVAPREAETIGIYNSEGLRQGTILISDLKPGYDSEEPLYRLGVLSDLHIGSSSSALEDFKRALNFFIEKEVSMTCICGDVTENGTEAELQKYRQAIVDQPVTNIFTTTGNHDCVLESRYGVDVELWSKYTDISQPHPQPLAFEEEITVNGKVDHFLFLGMSYWNFNVPYLDAHITWLEDKLDEYRNERCFVFTHLFFPDRAGNMNDIYPNYNWLSGVQLDRLQELCDYYVNSIWFSGHSHWEWSLQKYQDRANIYRADNAASGWCVHVPSCGVPATSDGISTRETVASGSEGALIEVYENHVNIIGRDFISGKYLPVATYRLDTTPQQVAENITHRDAYYLEAADFKPYKGEGMTVTDVGDNYIDVIFTGQKQGYYVTNETFYFGRSEAVSLTVEDLSCWTNWDETSNTGTVVNTIENVGFYSGKYHLSSTNACLVDLINGVQFQTSSSSESSMYPIKLRMKAQMVFSPIYQGEEYHYLSVENFEINKYRKGTGTQTVSDSEDENYFEAIFNQYGEGFWVTNETFEFGLKDQKAAVIVEDVQAYHKVDGSWTEYQLDNLYNDEGLPKVGFYSGHYHLEPTLKCEVDPGKGVKFHASSGLAVPEGGLKLKMKVHMEFYSTVTNPEKHYISAEDFVKNQTKSDGEFTVKDIDDNWVELTFNQPGQGWYITNGTFSTSTKYAAIKFEEKPKIIIDGKEVSDIPDKVGFYMYDDNDKAYYYSLENGETKPNTSTDASMGGVGVQFQTSSSYSSGFPITIRMKALMVCY